jgi:ubiquinone/menaquinone biosynthesis C-methylase UbiE
MYGLPFGDGAFDTVTMDRVIGSAARPKQAIAEAARTLRQGGRLCIVEDFEALADVVNGNPLAALRDWLAAAGLNCERVRPVDTDASHLLIVIARSNAATRLAA